MPKGSTFINDILLHLLENSDIATIGDASGILGSAVSGSIFVSLHTADPNAGTQTTSEATYTSYARVAYDRTGSNWTTLTGSTENTFAITFPAATGGGDTITHFAVGADVSGAGLILYSGTTSLTISAGITPRFQSGSMFISEA